jgi:hypothetical protein
VCAAEQRRDRLPVGIIAACCEHNRALLVHRLVGRRDIARHIVRVGLLPVADARASIRMGRRDDPDLAVRARAVVHRLKPAFRRIATFESKAIRSAAQVQGDELLDERLVPRVVLGVVSSCTCQPATNQPRVCACVRYEKFQKLNRQAES